jgi:hypothetical protein
MKIEFRPYESFTGLSGHTPLPAVRFIPKWFSGIPKFTNGDKKFKFFSDSTVNLTVKACPPFLDSMTTGYMLTLENDLCVEKKEDGSHFFTWPQGGSEFISSHGKEQISAELVPSGFSSQPFKFKNGWSIKLPKGYSAIFFHPLNRPDLPFHTISGVVDCDEYELPINFPFFIKEDFDGVIKAGTPIVQLLPFKREKWESKMHKYDEAHSTKKYTIFRSWVTKGYKTLFWKRKDYR